MLNNIESTPSLEITPVLLSSSYVFDRKSCMESLQNTLSPEIFALINQDLYTDFQEALARLPFSAREQSKIQETLLLMIEIHSKQDPRPDGEAYINHPLRVALRCITEFGVVSCDGICAALLHDSVEDQAKALVQSVGIDPQSISKEALKTTALDVITTRFSDRTAKIVSLLTNPDFTLYVENKKSSGDLRDAVVIKNEAYFIHFFEILDADAEAFKIKLADFSENALSLGNLEEGSKKDKLRSKYGPVLAEVILRASAEDHKLQVSERFLAHAKDVYEACYKKR